MNKKYLVGGGVLIIAILIAVVVSVDSSPYDLRVGDDVTWRGRFGRVTAIESDRVQIIDMGPNWSWSFSPPDHRRDPVWFSTDSLSGIRKRTEAERREREVEEEKLRRIRGH